MRVIFPPSEEMRLVREFIAATPRGYFVDVGANDPVVDSQSYHLEQIGWTGILVEPQPDLAEKLRATRKAKVFACACGAPDDDGKMMRLHVAGVFSSFDPALMVTGVEAEHTVDVSVRSLDGILAECEAPVPLDLLSIDVEGFELEVLRGFDLARWRPRLILLEDHVGDLRKHAYMKAHGYRLMRRTGLNAWYVPAGEAPDPGLRGRWELLRKYYLALPFRKLRDAKRRLRDRWRKSR